MMFLNTSGAQWLQGDFKTKVPVSYKGRTVFFFFHTWLAKADAHIALSSTTAYRVLINNINMVVNHLWF